VADLQALLTDETMWGLPQDRCRTLIDRTDPIELMESLDRLARIARDTLVVYYAGHGIVDREGTLVIPTWSTTVDLPKYTALPYSHIREIVGTSRAERRIIVLDCCFSGRALEAMSDIGTTIVGQMDAEGTFIMTSAPATSVSIAPEGTRYTAFTGELLDIIRNGVPSLSELLSLDDVYDQIMTAMVRRGWPRPQRLGTNTVGKFGFLRNRAWLKGRKVRPVQDVMPAHDPQVPAALDATILGRYRHRADGVRAAVAVVAPMLGPAAEGAEPADTDGLMALDQAYPAQPGGHPATGEQEGITLVRETMLAMRSQYGDGAITAAVILGTLVDGLWSLIAADAAPDVLDREVAASAAMLVSQLVPLPGTAIPPAAGELRAAIRAAVGIHQAAEAVIAAVTTVGARNVEVLASAAADGTHGTFVLETTVLAPNSAAGPIALEDPLIVVSPDGQLDTRVLAAAGREARSGILIIAPAVSIHVARSLLHSFDRMVIVRPDNPGFDLAAMRDQLTPASGPGWCRARRALVLAGTTTIERPPADLDLSKSRLTVSVGAPQSLAVATRTLAVARSAADAGLVPGGGTTLYDAARSQDATASAVSALMAAAACAPYRLLKQSADPGSGPQATRWPTLDALATVRGAVMHATASASRYLAHDQER
jgi:Caspase domain